MAGRASGLTQDTPDQGPRADPPAAADPTRRRLRSEDRRAALIEAALRLVAEEGIAAVSMETVATRAGVSRPLVYKHFANRDELLAEAHRQEAARLDAAIVAAVEQVTGFEAKVRAMIGAVLDAETTHRSLFAALVQAGIPDSRFRQERKARDRRTVRFFASLAAREFGLDRAEARAATAVLLTGMESIQAQWRSRPSPERRRFLEDLYVDLVTAALRGLSTRGPDSA